MGPNSMAQKLRLAVLIDGENISAEYAGTLFDEIANWATPAYAKSTAIGTIFKVGEGPSQASH